MNEKIKNALIELVKVVLPALVVFITVCLQSCLTLDAKVENAEIHAKGVNVQPISNMEVSE